eukprot:scaffold3515_cov126-Cylindrotheca_fusiformis.AAC.3
MAVDALYARAVVRQPSRESDFDNYGEHNDWEELPLGFIAKCPTAIWPMKVSLDATRLFHLLALIAFTIGGGQLLIHFFEWNGLTAYGTSCTLVCQISNVLMKVWSGELEAIISKKDSDDTDTKGLTKPRKTGKIGNPKKKQK